MHIPTVLAQSLTASNVTGETSERLTSLVDFFIVKIPSFIAAFIVFIIFYLLAKAIKGIVEAKLAQSIEENKELQILAGRTVSAVTIIIGATVALNIAGIDLTVIIAAAGFGIGFALRDIIVNFLAGIMVLAQKHFTIGDFIKVNDTVGKIIEIQSRATILQALDGTKVVVPNSELFNQQVISYTSNPFRRIEVIVGVEYDTDLNLAVKTCYQALKNTQGVLPQPKPAVIVDEFADSSINLIVRAWVESRSGWLQIKSDLAVNIKTAFDSVGIGIPFPIRTIVFDKDVKESEQKAVFKGKKPEWIKNEQKTEIPESEKTVEKTSTQPPEVKPQVETKPSPDQPGAMFIAQTQTNEEG
jgi:small-conductance mechanosensitive channel